LRVYLDTSVYNRPFDDQTQPRIWLETLALAVILQMIETGEIQLVSSSVVSYENSCNPFPIRKRWVTRCLQLAAQSQHVDERIRARAQELEMEGIGAIDALHLACAEAAESQYFLTCDDRVVRRYSGSMQVLNPVNFVMSTTEGQP
jgi:PIN domain